jgi:glycosyltransferase involved in cell wall biosynthesis
MDVIIIPHGFQEHYTLGFVNGLATRGVRVNFVRAANMDSTLLHPDISWTDLGCNTEGNIGVFRKAFRLVSYHMRLIAYVAKRQGAIVHVTGLTRRPVLLTGIVDGLMFRALARKYVLTIHDLLPHDKHTVWNRWVRTLVYRIPHMLVVHTSKMKHELNLSFGIEPERILVMEHGLNDIVPDHGRSSSECRAELGLPADASILLLFGRIAPYKGVETLLDSFRDASDETYLVIAGSPYSAMYSRKLEGLLQEHPGRDRILYHAQFIGNADVATYFRAADALVMPYRHIDQSGVLFLAFRFGLPVIAFDVGSLREYVTEDTGVLIEGDTAEDLVKGIARFQAERQRFSPERMRKLTTRFRWESVLAPLVTKYAE